MRQNRNQYSLFERNCANFFSRFPQVKRFIKLGYQRLNYWCYRETQVVVSDYFIHTICDGDKETFFGYYDKSPINKSNTHIIFQSTILDTSKLPSTKYPVQVILYELSTHKIVARFDSCTYNWQQGTKLQWIDNFNFIYNSIDEASHYCSYIVNIETLHVRKIKAPIYELDGLGNAYSLNFDRLAVMRPDYGYFNHLPYKLSESLHDDGIFRVDLKTGDIKLLLSIERILSCCPLLDSPANATIIHKVNHIMSSPSGEMFMFLHRYFISGIKFDRLIVCDKNAERLKLLAADGMVSHCCWENNENIIAYLRQHQIGDKYYRINVVTGKMYVVGDDIISAFGDGHPSVFGDNMIFDTYPDKARMQTLLSYNLKRKHLTMLGRFFTPLKYHDQTRCDLHPKWSYDGKKIFFDSVYLGKRILCYINV